MYKFVLLFFLFLPLPFFSYSQSNAPKREFRAVWIASVANIDWPGQKGLSPVVQQAELRYILDEQKKNGMNAVIIQVRPAADAFYRSKLEPWSEWLTGKQGREPNPPYDPLEFMLQESHARGLEFHAWFNPYRTTLDSTTIFDANHITRKKPEWFLKYEGKLLFNPGLPEVREYIIKIIMDVVRRYDIDGVHFDDYFYPYPVANKPFPDDSTFIKSPEGFTDKNDWRRHNVDVLIKTISDSIKAVKPYVKFGISPFGVWKNQSDDPQGSATRAGAPSYSTLYADTRKWMELGWIDYLVPQVYWHIGHPAADYKTIVEWWTKNSFNRHLYIGHGPYKINRENYPAWFGAGEIPRQLNLNRTLPKIQGSVYFSSKSIMSNPNSVQDTLRNYFYKTPALLPLMPWKVMPAPAPPVNISAKDIGSGILLRWQLPEQSAQYFVIYRFPDKTKADINDPKYIISKIYGTKFAYEDSSALPGKRYQYIVTALDRIQNESIAPKPVKVRKR